MIHTIKHRKKLNAQLLERVNPRTYELRQFGPIERLWLHDLPPGALPLESTQYAEAVCARSYLRDHQPVPVLIEVRRSGHMNSLLAYDVNYVNPANPHDIDLLSHYMSHTKVYAII